MLVTELIMLIKELLQTITIIYVFINDKEVIAICFDICIILIENIIFTMINLAFYLLSLTENLK